MKELGRIGLFAGLLVSLALPARAEFPALSRELYSERYIATPGELRAIAAQRRLGLWLASGVCQRGDVGGSWDPVESWKRVGGGRIDTHAIFGRTTFGGEAIADTHRAVEDREFSRRLYGTIYVPEARISLVGSAGFEDGGYRGFDVTAEVLAGRLKLVKRAMDFYPRLLFWTRVRRIDDESHATASPAVGLLVPHAPLLGSQPVAGLSVLTDLEDGRSPITTALFQFGWSSLARPLWGGSADPDAPPQPGSRSPSDISRNWLIVLGYAAPLDRRSDARLVLQAGLRFVRALGD